MPIEGLTDQPRAFVEIGQLRKGAPKPKDDKKPGSDLTYFRAVFYEGEEEAAKMFHESYPDEPRAIEVFLPFDEPSENFETWKEAYLAGGLIHRCNRVDVQYAVDPSSGEVLVQDGKDADGNPVKCDGGPVAYYTDKKGKEQPVYCKPEGRLKVIVPALRRLAYMTVITHSIWDIVNLSKELEGYWWENGQKLRGVRFILKRRPKMISTPSGTGGKRARRKKWLLDIEPAPSWVEEQFLALEQAARPRLLEEPLELPNGVPDTNGNDNVNGEVIYEMGESGHVWEDEGPPSWDEEGNGEMPPIQNMNDFYEKAQAHFGYPDKDAIVNALMNFLGSTVLQAQRQGTTMEDLWGVLVDIKTAEKQPLAM